MPKTIEHIHWPDAPDLWMPYAPAIKVKGGTTVYLAGVTAAPVYHHHPHRPEEFDSMPRDMAGQARAALENLKRGLEAVGATFADIVTADRFVTEFDALRTLYANYKRQAALLDFDDLLHQARDLLAQNGVVRDALSRCYPRILVDEFQDTDPLQAEILWLLCGDGGTGTPWLVVESLYSMEGDRAPLADTVNQPGCAK